MIRKQKIIYWIATIWLSLGMLSTAIVQLLHEKKETEFMTHLGYPAYFMTILGVWKILGVAAILLPRLPLLKEWAYAGFFLAMSGAMLSHGAAGSLAQVFPSLLLLLLTMISWKYRPADRKLFYTHKNLSYEPQG